MQYQQDEQTFRAARLDRHAGKNNKLQQQQSMKQCLLEEAESNMKAQWAETNHNACDDALKVRLRLAQGCLKFSQWMIEFNVPPSPPPPLFGVWSCCLVGFNVVAKPEGSGTKQPLWTLSAHNWRMGLREMSSTDFAAT